MSEQDSRWVDVIGLDEVPEDDVMGVEIAGRDIAIYKVSGQVFATDNICTHAHARLCDGYLEGHDIECPLHQGRFDIRDGKALCGPVTDPLRTFAVRVHGSRVQVMLD
jgi:naphthalene 1,2-dioxygenase system ferredoxin subunit